MRPGSSGASLEERSMILAFVDSEVQDTLAVRLISCAYGTATSCARGGSAIGENRDGRRYAHGNRHRPIDCRALIMSLSPYAPYRRVHRQRPPRYEELDGDT